MIKQVIALFKKEILTELRLQYAFYGVLLYVVATTFVLFLAISEPDKKVWIGLYWIILLFASVNAIAKSFLQESKGRMLYYYTLTSAPAFIIAKMLFNAFLMMFICVLNYLLIQLFLGNPIEQLGLFLSTTLLGSLSLALLFTLLSAVAAKAQQNAALVAILGFPLIIPLLLILIKVSQLALAPSTSIPWAMLAILATYNILLVLLSIILFPFIWKE